MNTFIACIRRLEQINFSRGHGKGKEKKGFPVSKLISHSISHCNVIFFPFKKSKIFIWRITEFAIPDMSSHTFLSFFWCHRCPQDSLLYIESGSVVICHLLCWLKMVHVINGLFGMSKNFALYGHLQIFHTIDCKMFCSYRNESNSRIAHPNERVSGFF